MVRRKNDKGPARSIQDIKDREGSLPTGVEGTNIPVDFHIPPATLEDVDRAVFNLFEKRLRLEVTTGQQVVPVRTLFATGERVFLVKNDRPPRDRNGTFILPIVAIRRSGLEQSKPGVISGRGMGQNMGDMVIKTRLSEKDPGFQSVLNKLRIKNQDNVASQGNELRASEPRGSLPGRLASRRVQGTSINSVTGELLAPDLNRNIFEIITMPFPHFFTALYEVTIWTQYTQHMNAVLERFMTSYDAQGNQFRLDSDKGYWYVAYVDDDISSEDNFSDFSEDERFIRYKFQLKVPAYLHGKERHGSGIPFRKFLSAPNISFELNEGAIPANGISQAPVGSGKTNKFILSDVQQLDKRGDQVDSEREAVRRVPDVVTDPFGNDKTRFVRVLSRNQRKGETVMTRLIRKIEDVNF